MRPFSYLLLILTFSTQAHAADVTPDIPYPDALHHADVSETNISSLTTQGLIIGNGELNAIVYSVGNDIHLRIGKNDCWDMRVDTKNDPPLPLINVATGKVTGHGEAGSWKAPYPAALPCAELVLGAHGPAAVTSAHLDLAKAVATVQGRGEATEVRILAQSNVILIRSNRPATFSGILDFLQEPNLAQWVSKADLGTQDECQYLHQNIPGDQDVDGMDIYIVTEKKEGLRAVAVVTSRDSAHPLDDAVALAHATLADADAVAKHEAAWGEFWSKSGVELGDQQLQNWWYRMVYFYRVFSRSGGNAIGLAAAFDHLVGWHNALTLNYNIQQTYLAAGPINHPELLEPFIDVLNRNLPRGQWFAKTSFVGAEGAFFNCDLWPFEPDPAKCTSNCLHQQTYLPWSYTWGMAGHAAVVLWDYYLYAPTPAHLDRIYPLLKEFGTFYCSILEKCALVDGKRKMGPSFFPELGGYSEYNVCYDIHYITAGLRISRAAAVLKNDDALVARIDKVINQIPPYGTIPDPDQGGQTIIQEWQGLTQTVDSDRHGTLIQCVFPAGIINWFSSDDMKELAKRTINRVEKSTTHANSNVTINVARARLGLGDEAIANAKVCFSAAPAGKYSQEQPNGLFYWNDHGYYITEQVAIARLVSELLLQSVGDIIRIFPAWPSATDAHFARLLAQGGFEVSASQTNGNIEDVRLSSTVGGTAQVLSPWPQGFTVVEQDGGPVAVAVASGISSFPTTAGKSYLLKPANR